MRKTVLFACTVLGSVANLTAEARDTTGQELQLWTRKQGDHGMDAMVDVENNRTVKISDFSPLDVSLFDAQYGKKAKYNAVPLEKIVTTYDKCGACDMILLHFSNGMQVPLPRNPKSWGQLNPQVAIGLKSKGAKSFKADFPQIAKKDERYRDPRPIAFQGNKVVVKELWHPLIPDPKKAGFSPWSHVTTLTGIEFVVESAYYGQFHVEKTPERNKGLDLFRDRCQYCHGIQHVGARFGWDYLTPLPIYKLREINHIYQLVKYRYHDELERGLMMPEQADVSTEQTGQLWAWLKALDAEGGIKKYQYPN